MQGYYGSQRHIRRVRVIVFGFESEMKGLSQNGIQ